MIHVVQTPSGYDYREVAQAHSDGAFDLANERLRPDLTATMERIRRQRDELKRPEPK